MVLFSSTFLVSSSAKIKGVFHGVKYFRTWGKRNGLGGSVFTCWRDVVRSINLNEFKGDPIL